MIHINLLPVREIRRRNAAKKEIYAGVALVFFVVIAFLAVGLWQSLTISGLEQEEQRLQAEKQKYTKILNDIKKMEEEKQLLLKRIDIINKLKQESSLTVHVLDEIANLTPSHRIWLKSLSQNETQLNLTGMALDEQTIAKYMDDLENSQYIQNVKLVRTAMEVYADRNLKSFTISCQVMMPTSK